MFDQHRAIKTLGSERTPSLKQRIWGLTGASFGAGAGRGRGIDPWGRERGGARRATGEGAGRAYLRRGRVTRFQIFNRFSALVCVFPFPPPRPRAGATPETGGQTRPFCCVGVEVRGRGRATGLPTGLEGPCFRGRPVRFRLRTQHVGAGRLP